MQHSLGIHSNCKFLKYPNHIPKNVTNKYATVTLLLFHYIKFVVK